MGDRYTLTVLCPGCGRKHLEVWYAPTCGFTHHKCICGLNIDLAEVTGISYEDCSNRQEMEEIVKLLEKPTEAPQ